MSSQAFYPLSDNPYLVVVAPSGEFDESKIEVFRAGANQGVNYYPGTWHHYSLALNSVSDFLVIDRGGPEDNCEEVKLTEPIIIAMKY
jgi:ureidoglycolate lyase